MRNKLIAFLPDLNGVFNVHLSYLYAFVIINHTFSEAAVVGFAGLEQRVRLAVRFRPPELDIVGEHAGRDLAE